MENTILLTKEERLENFLELLIDMREDFNIISQRFDRDLQNKMEENLKVFLDKRTEPDTQYKMIREFRTNTYKPMKELVDRLTVKLLEFKKNVEKLQYYNKIRANIENFLKSIVPTLNDMISVLKTYFISLNRFLQGISYSSEEVDAVIKELMGSYGKTFEKIVNIIRRFVEVEHRTREIIIIELKNPPRSLKK